MVCNYFSRKPGKEYFRFKGCLNSAIYFPQFIAFNKCVCRKRFLSPFRNIGSGFSKIKSSLNFLVEKTFLEAGLNRALVEIVISANVPYPLTQNLWFGFLCLIQIFQNGVK